MFYLVIFILIIFNCLFIKSNIAFNHNNQYYQINNYSNFGTTIEKFLNFIYNMCVKNLRTT